MLCKFYIFDWRALEFKIIIILKILQAIERFKVKIVNITSIEDRIPHCIGSCSLQTTPASFLQNDHRGAGDEKPSLGKLLQNLDQGKYVMIEINWYKVISQQVPTYSRYLWPVKNGHVYSL